MHGHNIIPVEIVIVVCMHDPFLVATDCMNETIRLPSMSDISISQLSHMMNCKNTSTIASLYMYNQHFV